MSPRHAAFVSALAAAGLLGAGAIAQVPVERTPLQTNAYPGGHTTQLTLVAVPNGGSVPRHTHPGIEVGYVVEGEAVLEIEGQAPLPLRTGDSYLVPAGKIHAARNTSGGRLRVVATFVVAADQPLATPAK